jgi:multidrug efflux pump
MAKVEKIALETPGVDHTVALAGMSFVTNTNSSNYGSMFITLKPFPERRGAELSGEAILARLRQRMATEVPEARVLVFGAPAVSGLGNAGGFKLMVQSTGEVNYPALQGAADRLALHGSQQPGFIGLFNSFRAQVPQLYVHIDREKAKAMGVQLTDVFDALQANLGSYYVNDFNRFGRTWQVNVQADAPFRLDADAVRKLKVRNANGDVVPLGAVAEVRESDGPVQVTRYNMFPAAAINGATQPGVSTGDVMATMELAENRPKHDPSGLS